MVDQQRVTVRRKSDRRNTFVEQVQRRAYEIYEARGRATGHALDDWLQAERELRVDVGRFESTTRGQMATHVGEPGRRS